MKLLLVGWLDVDHKKQSRMIILVLACISIIHLSFTITPFGFTQGLDSSNLLPTPERNFCIDFLFKNTLQYSNSLYLVQKGVMQQFWTLTTTLVLVILHTARRYVILACIEFANQ